MKTLKNVSILIMLILFSSFSYAQEASAVSISNTQNIHDANEVYADFHGDITATTWDKDYVLIEMRIEAENVSLGVAKYLVSLERFCLKMRPLGDKSLVLSMPNCKLEVLINGQKLTEKISYQVFVPKGVTLISVESKAKLIPCPTGKRA